jgi:hypothetical protein
MYAKSTVKDWWSSLTYGKNTLLSVGVGAVNVGLSELIQWASHADLSSPKREGVDATVGVVGVAGVWLGYYLLLRARFRGGYSNLEDAEAPRHRAAEDLIEPRTGGTTPAVAAELARLDRSAQVLGTPPGGSVNLGAADAVFPGAEGSPLVGRRRNRSASLQTTHSGSPIAPRKLADGLPAAAALGGSEGALASDSSDEGAGPPDDAAKISHL